MKKLIIILFFILIFLISSASAVVYDDFNRADNVTVGNGWYESTTGFCNQRIFNNTLRISWTEDPAAACRVSKGIGTQDPFDIEYVYRVSGGGVNRINLAINGDNDTSPSSQGTTHTHGVNIHRIRNPAGNATTVSTMIQSIIPDQWYHGRFKWDGTTLSLKVWKDGTVEPGAFNYTQPHHHL